MAGKVLIIRFSSIGDIVLTTPVVRCLRLQSDAEIHYLTKPAFAEILTANPFVNKVITLSDDFDQLISMLRVEHYDHIIDLHNNLRSRRIRLALKRPSSSFHKLNFQKWIMVNFKIDRLPDIHIVDRYLAAASFSNIQNDGQGLDFFIPPEKEMDLTQYRIHNASFITMAIGAAHNTKCMTASQLATLTDIIQRPVFLLGGIKEKEKASEVMALSGNKTLVNLCGKVDLFGSASVMRQASGIITHDTGLMHIAAALNKPQVVVWGNTIPEFGMYPYYPASTMSGYKSFEIMGLSCRPCSKLGYAKCPKGHFKCMLDHPLMEIAAAAVSWSD